MIPCISVMEVCVFAGILSTLFIPWCGGQELDSSLQNKGPTIVSLHIRSDIVYRFASTKVVSTIVNDDFVDREATFDLSLPEAAFISNFTLEIDGVEYPGEVKEKVAAQKQYDRAKKRGHSAGHISARPRDTNKFRVSINVAAQGEVAFVLTYEELLRRKLSTYEHTIYIDPKQIVDKMVVEVFIYESRDITTLRVPPIRNDILNTVEINAQNDIAVIERPSGNSAYIRYSPSTEDQRLASEQGVSGLFIVEYDLERSLDAGDVYMVNGYFVHFFAPVGLNPLRKRILFVLDISGSMSFDRKIHQLKEAMSHILDDLNEADLFNIVTFASNTQFWSDTMKKATEANVALAKDYVEHLVAEGGTNVNAAVLEGLGILQKESDLFHNSVTAPLIVFLTDGEPTVGETNLKTILKNIDNANSENIQLFSLAFGNDADTDFLKRMSSRNNAFSRKIYAASDAALQLKGFYDEISNVLLANVSFNYLEDVVNDTTLTRSRFPSFFDGSELVVTGRFVEDTANTLSLNVIGNSENGPITLSTTTNVIDPYGMHTDDVPEFVTSLDFERIIERIWAYMSIKKLLDDRFRTENPFVKDDLKFIAINLALKYNFVTPVTSMVVTKPERKRNNDTDVNVQDDDGSSAATGQDQGNAALQAPSGPLDLTGKGSTLMTPPGYADSDPHFIVNIKGLEQAVCFDVMGKPGEVYQLIKDRYSGVIVNAKVVANKQTSADSGNATSLSDPLKTFLGEIVVRRWHLHIFISPGKIKVNGQTIPWRNGTTISHGKTKLVADKRGHMVAILFKDRIGLLIMRHIRPKALVKQGKVNYLGFYIVDDRGLSYHTHGLLGQFLHRTVILKKSKTRNGKTLGRLRVSGNTSRSRKVMASLGHRLNLATQKNVACWMVQHNGQGLIDGDISDYLVNQK